MNPDFKNPGHSTNKNYPYRDIPSKILFPYRPEIGQQDGKVFIAPGSFKDSLPADPWDADNKWNQFLLDRLYQFSEYLKIAEGQIEDLLEERPFMPEHFGFELAHSHQDITEAPVRIYVSKFKDSVAIWRKPADINNPEWNYALWMLTTKNEDGTMKEQELHLPCHRIAYAAFFALGIQIEGEKKKEDAEESMSLADMSDMLDNIPEGYKAFDVIYKEDATIQYPQGRKIDLTVVAEDKANAISRAKFILETNEAFNIKDSILFENIFVTERVENPQEDAGA